MQNYPNYRESLLSLMRDLGQKIHPTMSGFGQLHKAGMSAGALDVKTKELMALSIAISGRCAGCIAFHVHDALKAGASEAEVHETIGVAVVMGGGPSVMYGCEALQALKEFHGNIIQEV
jgi:AhpD family alkylhydroperoxidase